MAVTDITNAIDKISGKITSLKTYGEVSQNFKDLSKKAANSTSKANSQITSQLDKIKDLQKRFLREPPNSMDQLLGFLKQTRGSGDDTMSYIRKKILETAVVMESKATEIVKQETIKALGCSQEQTYKGVSAANLQSQPLPSRPPLEGIYIPIQSVDLFSNLKNAPTSQIGKAWYEQPDPSTDPKFKPYGGDISYPMNKQLYQLTDSGNAGKSLSQINGKNYLGKSGQNLFDLQYTTTNGYGITGNYYRVLLIDRQLDSGKNVNNVGQFLSDYYSTINLIDPVDIGLQLTNILSGAIDIKAQIGVAGIENQTKFSLLIQRILGLCFDARKEIDVSGVAKVAELDGLDDSFFELTEVDLRNIDVIISNIQNGVIEFVDCNNVKLPVDSDALLDQLIEFRNSASGQTTDEKVKTIETIIDSISQNPSWSAQIPANFNVQVSINTNVIKKIPLAFASGILSPKVLLPLYTLLAVVQSGSTYTNTVPATSTNTQTSSSNVPLSALDFIKLYRTFVINVVSRINAEFLKVLFDLLKKDILNLVESILADVVKSSIAKKYLIILRLLEIALVVAELLSDYRKCKSLLDEILKLLSLISGAGLGSPGLPFPLLALAPLLPGTSPERSTINTIQLLQGIGIPTGALPDGSPNLMLLNLFASHKGVDQENSENGKVDGFVIVPPLLGGIVKISAKAY
jgi:hypothetical protein